MAIYSDVITRLDERSAKAASDEMAKQFAQAGTTAGVEFRKGLQDSMHGADLKSFTDSFAGSIAPGFHAHGENAAKGFSEGLESGLRHYVGGALSEATSQFGALGEVASSALEFIPEVAGGAALGVASIAVAAVAVGVALFEVGSSWNEVASNIAARTDQVGDGLNRLVDITKDVTANSAASAGAVGNIVSQLSQSLPDLNENNSAVREMASALAMLQTKGINVDVREMGMAFKGFGVDAGASVEALHSLYEASAKAGIPINDLTHNMTEVGPAARTMGLDFGETANMLVNFERGGVDAGRAVNALDHAAQVFAKSNIDLNTGLGDTITQIRAFIDLGTEAGDRSAVDLAGKVFGTKGAEQFVDLIRQGKLSVDDLHKGLSNMGPTFDVLDQKTRTWGENWDLLGNHIDRIAGKISDAIGLFDALNSGFTKLNDLFEDPQVKAQAQLNERLDAVSRQRAQDQAHHPHPLDSRSPQDIAGSIADAKGGSGGIELPYPAEYGQPPAPGETPEHWRQRMASIDAAHTVAEKQAEVDKLDKDNTASAADRVKAHNELVKAQISQTEAEQRLDTQKQQSVQVPYGPGYGAAPRPGETAEQYGAEQRLFEAQHSRAEAAAQLVQVQQSATHTDADLTEAQNKLSKARVDETQAQMRLFESANKATDSLGQVGEQLDKDFGISKGLPGIVENITKMLANFGAAPILGALKAGQIANGFKPGEAGSGLSSVLANQGVFGSQYVAQPQGSTGVYSAAAISPAGGVPGAAYPGDAALLSQVPKGIGHYDNDTKDLSKGLVDCASGVEDLVNIMDGKSTVGGSLWTGNASSVLPGMGFMPGMGGPGDFRVGYNDHHMQATLPGGTNVNYGSTPAIRAGGLDGGEGAYDPSFTQHYYRPTGGTAPGFVGGGIPLSPSGNSGGSGSGAGNFNPDMKIDTSMASAGGMDLNTGNLAYALGAGDWDEYNNRGQAPGSWLFGQHPAGSSPLYNMTGLPQGDAPGTGGPPLPVNHSGPFGFGGFGGPTSPGDDRRGPVTRLDAGLPNSTGLPDSQAAAPAGTRESGGLPGSIAAGNATSAADAIRRGAFPAGGGGPGTNRTLIGGGEPAQGSGKGGIGVTSSGLLGSAIGAASAAGGMAVDAMAPGAGGAASAAMQIGVQEINRAIQFGSQAMGIGAEGLMQTFLPFGASELAQNSWATKLIGGIAGAGVSLPNTAGGKKDPKGLTPEQAASFQDGKGQKPEDIAGSSNGQGGQGGGDTDAAGHTVNSHNTYNTTIQSSASSIGGAAKDFQDHTGSMNQGPGM